MRKIILFFPVFLLLLGGCRQFLSDTTPRKTSYPGFVYVEDDHFMLDGETWFPLMLNYKVRIAHQNDSLVILPIDFYHSKGLLADFQLIADMGFNCLRICMDSVPDNCTSEDVWYATEQMLHQAEQCHLKVMLLIKKPLDEYWMNYTKGLLQYFADNPTLWSYDFFNEPLYFDPIPDRDKVEAYHIVCQWRDLMQKYAPHQLFTIGFAEPIEVFEWDPTILPVDFVEIHTYHPLRVASEMRWYSDNCKNKPWMVGETSLPADDDIVSYEEQQQFIRQAYTLARQYHAAGFGWWCFQDCPGGCNFEGLYTGLLNSEGEQKPAVQEVNKLKQLVIPPDDHQKPSNYYNMLGYNNIRLKGKVIDAYTRQPIHGAVIRGWTKDWIGMNTFTDENGEFTLYSNDFNVQFEISAPGKNTIKLYRDNIQYYYAMNTPHTPIDSLPQRYLEYHSIDYHPFLEGDSLTLLFHPKHFNQCNIEGDFGTIKLLRFNNPLLRTKKVIDFIHDDADADVKGLTGSITHMRN